MSARERRRKPRRRGRDVQGTRRTLIVAGGITAGATIAMSGVAQAAPVTYTVGTNADSSSGGACTTPTNTDCSLREAIDLANANAGFTDTIVFNSNLTGQTINLTTGNLHIGESVTIAGPGASQLTVDGTGAGRIFYVGFGADNAISGMTMTDGDAGTSNGGAIYLYDANLTLSNVVVSDSYSTSNTGPGTGGGIFIKIGRASCREGGQLSVR